MGLPCFLVSAVKCRTWNQETFPETSVSAAQGYTAPCKRPRMAPPRAPSPVSWPHQHRHTVGITGSAVLLALTLGEKLGVRVKHGRVLPFDLLQDLQNLCLLPVGDQAEVLHAAQCGSRSFPWPAEWVHGGVRGCVQASPNKHGLAAACPGTRLVLVRGRGLLLLLLHRSGGLLGRPGELSLRLLSPLTHQLQGWGGGGACVLVPARRETPAAAGASPAPGAMLHPTLRSKRAACSGYFSWSRCISSRFLLCCSGRGLAGGQEEPVVGEGGGVGLDRSLTPPGRPCTGRFPLKAYFESRGILLVDGNGRLTPRLLPIVVKQLCLGVALAHAAWRSPARYRSPS